MTNTRRTQGATRHLDTATARKYADGMELVVFGWRDHVESCAGCRSLVHLLRNEPCPRRPRLFSGGHFDWGNVIELVGSWRIDGWVRLSIENRDNPSIQRLTSQVEDLFQRSWLDNGLASDCTVQERIERDDIVLVAVDPDGGDDSRPLGAIFGRLSTVATTPSWEEMGCEDDEPVSINFYSVVVDEGARNRSVGVKLLLAAASSFTRTNPELVVQTMSPLAGFRAYVAQVVGVSVASLGTSGVARTTRAVIDALAHVESRPSLEEIVSPQDRDRFESAVGVPLRQWLVDACTRPWKMLSDWRCAREDHDRSRAMEDVMCQLAERYAKSTWSIPPDRSPVMACYVSHFHLRNGAEFAGTRAFSRLDDHENLYMTATFRYPSLEPAQARRNYQGFLASRPSVPCGRRG